MKRILVASDFSARSDRALRRGVVVAKSTGASLSLLHVVDGDRLERVIAREHEEAHAVLANISQNLRIADGVIAEPIVKIDDLDTGILQGAEDAAADLIIVGSHRKRLRDVFTGTTVERVVRRSRFPLLVAVQSAEISYQRTLLALDFDEASRAAGRAAMALGVFDHTDVTVTHVFDAPAQGMLQRGLGAIDAVGDYVADEAKNAEERLQTLVAELGLPRSALRITANTGTAAASILESARNENAQLIVLGSNQREGIERVFVGSVTEEVIREARRDVLIIPVDRG